jgi:hypothetical protein
MKSMALLLPCLARMHGGRPLKRAMSDALARPRGSPFREKNRRALPPCSTPQTSGARSLSRRSGPSGRASRAGASSSFSGAVGRARRKLLVERAPRWLSRKQQATSAPCMACTAQSSSVRVDAFSSASEGRGSAVAPRQGSAAVVECDDVALSGGSSGLLCQPRARSPSRA